MQNTVPQNDELVKRLKRAHGHLAKVITMLSASEDCLKVTQQLYAVEQALVKAKQLLIHNHVNYCLEQNTQQQTPVNTKLLEDFKLIVKYL